MLATIKSEDKTPYYNDSFDIYIRFRTHRYMAEILPIWRKTLYNQSMDLRNGFTLNKYC